MGLIIGLIIGTLIGAVIAGFFIWLVGKLNLGLSVDSFGSAMLAGLFIGVLTTLARMLVPGIDGIVGALVNLVIAAAVIYLAGQVFKGLTVNGFGGAFIAALAIAVISFLINMMLVGLITTAAVT